MSDADDGEGPSVEDTSLQTFEGHTGGSLGSLLVSDMRNESVSI
jgi:hypothetical protein